MLCSLLLVAGCGQTDSSPQSNAGSVSDRSKASDRDSTQDAQTPIADAGGSNNRSATDQDQTQTSNTRSQPAVQISQDAFLGAAHDGRLELVRQAVNGGMDVNTTDADKHTALHMAAYNGHTETVKFLIEQGAVVDCLDREGKSPLIHACTGPFPKTVELLLAKGADIELREGTESFTPLMMAAGLGETEVVRVLLENKADVNVKDQDGDQAIDHARNANHAEIVELLK